MLSFQSSSVYRSKLDAPKADGLVADRDPTLGKEIFDIAMTQVESVVEPDSIGNDISRESVALISIHGTILANTAR
jgi:hypothetical protein